MEVYVLFGRTFGDRIRQVLGVFSSMDTMKEAEEYLHEHGYGDFDFTSTSMDEY